MSTSSSTDPIVNRLRAAGCVFAEEEARLLISAARTTTELDTMVAERATGVPLEHVVGYAEFHGLSFVVAHGVFVPRRRTEFLVDQATVLAGSPAVVLDLCCGCGALGAALSAVLDPVELHACDIDPAAVRCARTNVAAAGGRVYQGDLYRPLPGSLRGRVDILLANAPYVPTGAFGLLPPEARAHEPRAALDGGEDGLDVLRRVIAGAPPWLAPGGHLLVETGERQVRQAVRAITDSGLTPSVAGSEDLDATVVIGTRPA